MAFTDEIDTALEDCHGTLATRSVTVTARTLGAWTASTGNRAATTTTAAVSAIRSERTAEDVSMAGATGGVLEVRYRVLKSTLDAESITPKPDDTVTDGLEVLPVCAVETEADGRAYILTCRTIRKNP